MSAEKTNSEVRMSEAIIDPAACAMPLALSPPASPLSPRLILTVLPSALPPIPSLRSPSTHLCCWSVSPKPRAILR